MIYGKSIASEKDLLNAINVCHDKGIQTVIISSCRSFDDNDSNNNRIFLIASSTSIFFHFNYWLYDKQIQICIYLLKDEDSLIKIEFERLPGVFYGTGDTFAAMFLAWFTKLNDLKVYISYSLMKLRLTKSYIISNKESMRKHCICYVAYIKKNQR